MQKNLIIFIFLLTSLMCSAQQLTVEETLTYINQTLANNKYGTTYYIVKLSQDGYITIVRQYNNSTKYLSRHKFHFSDVEVTKISSGHPLSVEFTCKSAGTYGLPHCITGSGSNISKNSCRCNIPNNDNYINTKVFNAMQYLLSSIKESDKYNRNDDDPFAPQNYNNRSVSISGSITSEKIKLESYGGVYKVWVKVGSVKQHFILDSGASNIALSLESEREFINKGIIKKKNYLTPALYKLADGSIIKCRRLILPEITIGNFTVTNVTASVGVSDSPLLLGRSFLDKFRKWSVDNTTSELLLEN